jgi:hypothetical protein
MNQTKTGHEETRLEKSRGEERREERRQNKCLLNFSFQIMKKLRKGKARLVRNFYFLKINFVSKNIGIYVDCVIHLYF